LPHHHPKLPHHPKKATSSKKLHHQILQINDVLELLLSSSSLKTYHRSSRIKPLQASYLISYQAASRLDISSQYIKSIILLKPTQADSIYQAYLLSLPEISRCSIRSRRFKSQVLHDAVSSPSSNEVLEPNTLKPLLQPLLASSLKPTFARSKPTRYQADSIAAESSRIKPFKSRRSSSNSSLQHISSPTTELLRRNFISLKV